MMAAVQATSLSRTALTALAASGALALLFLALQERRVPDPIVPFKLWRHRVLAIGNFGGVALGALIIGNGGFLPTYIQGVLGHGPAVAGAVLATSSVAWSATGIVAGRMMARHSYRAIGTLGAMLMIAGAVFSRRSIRRAGSGRYGSGRCSVAAVSAFATPPSSCRHRAASAGPSADRDGIQHVHAQRRTGAGRGLVRRYLEFWPRAGRPGGEPFRQSSAGTRAPRQSFAGDRREARRRNRRGVAACV